MIKTIKWVGVVFLIFVLALGLLGCGGGQVYNSPATGNIAGTVKDEADVIIVGATIVVEEADLSAITDADGYYILENLPVGTYDVATIADNHYPQTATVTVEKDEIVIQDFIIPQAIRAYTVSGAVTDKDTEGPLGGAMVTIEGTGWSATTEDDGSYSISDVEAGTYDITASKSGYTNQTETVTVEGDTTVDFELIALVQYDLTIDSTAGVSVTTPGEGTFTYDAGTVVDLVATPDAGYRFVEWIGDVGTIADFEAAATNITMSGDYSITASFAIMEATEVKVDSITYETFGSGKQLKIIVTLLDDLGNPVAGASVSATLYRDDGSWDFQGTTDSYGTVTFKLRKKDYTQGCYWMVVTAVAAEGLEWDGVTPENGYCKE